jgi:autotransporter-associated beta strand protein
MSSLSRAHGARLWVAMAFLAAGACLGPQTARAQDATWTGAGSDWNTGSNWSTSTAPTNTAIFTNNGAPTTVTTAPGIGTSINTLQFNAGAPNYTFTVTGSQTSGDGDFGIVGTGIVNNASGAPNLVAGFQPGPNATTGTFYFANTATAGNANITLNGCANCAGDGAGAGLQFQDSSTAANSVIISNGGQVAFSPFGGSSTAANSTITVTSAVAGGLVIFDSSSTAGNATITINDTGFLYFQNSSTGGSATITNNSGVNGGVAFYDNSTAGNARLINQAGSTTDFSGTTGPLGDGNISAGSIEGGGTFQLGGNTLTVGGNNGSTTVSGSIQDGGSNGGSGGSLIKVGSGTLILSGTNTYTGATTVNGGTLEVDGSIANTSSVTVNSGTTLTGVGAVGPTTIAANSVFAPGTPGAAGTFMTVTGNLGFQAGATYAISLNSSTSTFATVTGSASLAGTVNASFAPGGYVSKQYTILTATGGLGGTTFNSLTNSSLPAGASDSLSYDLDHVYLNLSTGFTGFTGFNINQQNVATALNNFFNDTGGLPTAFFGLSARGLSQVDGEAAADGQFGAFKQMDQFLVLMLDPFVDGRSGTGWPSGGGNQVMSFATEPPASFASNGALGYASVFKAPPKPAAPDQRWSAWGAGFGGYSQTNGNPTVGSTNVIAREYGFASGMDYHFSPDSVAGFAMAGGGTNWSLAEGLGGGRSDSFHGGIYGATRVGAAYVSAALAFADHAMTTDRFAVGGDQLSASFNAQNYGARIEAGYRYALPVVAVTPYGALQLQDFHTPTYSETDLTGGGFGLNYDGRTATDARSELGARFDDVTMLNGMLLSLRARAAWAHDWVTNPTLGTVFEALPGAGFIVYGAAPPKDSALLSVGAELHLTARWSLSAKFAGELAAASQTYAGTGTLRYTW